MTSIYDTALFLSLCKGGVDISKSSFHCLAPCGESGYEIQAERYHAFVSVSHIKSNLFGR
jgi:hypothetical protein